MTPEARLLLLKNLLARLDADAAAEHPRFRAVVSDDERDALRSLLGDQDAEVLAYRASSEPVVGPSATSGASSQIPAVNLNTEVLSLSSSPAPNWILGLDFGTAKSKAFGATDDEDPDLLPLAIGKEDKDLDGSVHEMSSSLWIDDDGLLFMGSEAVRRGMNSGDSPRQRLDSLKQQISQVPPEEGHAQLNRKLPQGIDPTSTLTYSDAIMCYLAYLTDLATTQLARDSRVATRYVRRRFTLPWWTMEQRQWAGKMLTKGLIRGQLLADTFHGKWQGGIHVEQIKRALQDAAAHDEQLTWMVLDEPAEGVLEALAAASARVICDYAARDLMLVVDVGAGTTDLSLFWVVQRPHTNGQPGQMQRAWPINPCGTAIRQAGDTLDSVLVHEVLRRADFGADRALEQRASNDLFRRVRRLKETLFRTGTVTVDLVDDHIVKLTVQEFMGLSRVRAFEDRICREIQGLLDRVDGSWEKAAGDKGITLVLTGGGCELPMIRRLKNRPWKIGTRQVRCQLAPDLPGDLASRFSQEFTREYPKLTVAMGGALRMLLDERDALNEWQGGAASPQGLERFQSSGV